MSLLLDSTIKVSLILLLVLSATAVLRKRSAAVRHWVLSAAVFCAALTPALGLVVPSWQVRVGGPSSAPQALQLKDTTAGLETTLQELSGAGRQERSNPVRMVTSSHLLGLWMAGVGLSLFVLLVGLGRLAWLASRCQPVVHGKWTELAKDISREYGVGRPVLLLQSDHPTLLVTWGLLRPKVILPRAARNWTEDRIRVVLCHELAHIRRRDWGVQMAAELLRCVYWFNPLVWIGGRRLGQESERACDDAVLNLGVEGPEYATHLLDLARAVRDHRRTWSPAPAIAHPSSLERRISAMLNARLNRNPITRSACVVTVIALSSITVPLAGFGTSTQATSATVSVSIKAQVSRLKAQGLTTDHEPQNGGRDSTPQVEQQRETDPIVRFGAPDQSPAASVSGSGTISGVVYDQSGGVLPGVTLTLTFSDGQRHANTDGRGHFEWVGLSAGDYVLQAQLPGFVTGQETFTFSAGQAWTLQRNITLQVGSVEETITVVDTDAPQPLGGARLSRPEAQIEETRRNELEKTLENLRQAAQSLRSFDQGSGVRVGGPIRVGGQIRAPRKVADVRPQYPQRLRDAGIEGLVALRGLIGTSGFLTGLHVVAAAHPDLATAAIEAVNQWEYQPTRLNGVAIETPVNVTINFQVRQAPAQASIKGVVKDNSGAVLPGVTVEVSGPALFQEVRGALTDTNGEYRIVDLPAGTYTVTFTLPGFATLRREGVELSGSFSATVNAGLRAQLP